MERSDGCIHRLIGSWTLSSASKFLSHIKTWISFKILRRRRQRGRQKSDRFNIKNNNFSRELRFCVRTFLCCHCTTMTWKCLIYVSQRKYTTDDEISSLFLNLDMVLTNSTLEGFTYVWQSQWLGVLNRNEDWKDANLLFQRRFRYHRSPRINGATALVRVKSCVTKVTVLPFRREHERKPGY